MIAHSNSDRAIVKPLEFSENRFISVKARYLTDPLKINRYKASKRWGCEPHQVPENDDRISIKVAPLRIRCWRYLPDNLGSKKISRNFAEKTFETSFSKIFSGGRIGGTLLRERVKTIHCDFSGAKSRPLYLSCCDPVKWSLYRHAFDLYLFFFIIMMTLSSAYCKIRESWCR